MDETITEWLAHLKQGDRRAAEHIWERFYERVSRLAKRRLAGRSPRHLDEEDVAASALHAFCAGALSGRFSRLSSREELWQLLRTITQNKAIDQVRKMQRRAEVGESFVAGEHHAVEEAFPELADDRALATWTVVCDEMLDQLEPKLRTVALLKLEGYTNEEIAERQERSVKTVERYLSMIRYTWSRDA